jgi:hypothetical protein
MALNRGGDFAVEGRLLLTSLTVLQWARGERSGTSGKMGCRVAASNMG